MENISKGAIIQRASYRDKIVGRDFWEHLCACIDFLGFKACNADPDVWMHPATTLDGLSYYNFFILYVNNALVISENGEKILRDKIGKYFELKKESIDPLTLYLGAKVNKVILKTGVETQSFSSA